MGYFLKGRFLGLSLFLCLAACSSTRQNSISGGQNNILPAMRESVESSAYVGCYTDKAARALPNELVATYSSSSTIEACIALAQSKGFAYAGLQDGGQCFAGNTLGYSKVADSNCNMPCFANSSEMCGGPYFNSIYSTASQAAPAPAPAPTPTPPAPAPVPTPSGASDYVGCYTDKAARALSNELVSTYSSSSTVEACIALAAAKGFTYAGLQDGGQCFAGNTLGYSKVADSNCNMPCFANSKEMCGGSYLNSIYTTGGSGTSHPPAPTATPQPAPQPAPVAQPSPISGTKVSLTSFGSVGKGGDDTGVFNSALSSTAGKGEVLEIPSGNYNIQPINLPSNAKIQCDSGVTISGESYSAPYTSLISIDGTSNVTLQGASASSCVIKNLKGASSIYTEWQHCIGILDGANNVNISGVSCTSNKGDGLDISRANKVTVSNSIFNGNFRNNISITGPADSITLNGNQANNASRAGIDVEPKGGPSYVVTNIVLNSNTSSNNASGGLSVGDDNGSNVSVTINNHVANNNGGAAYFVENTNGSVAAAGDSATNCTSSSCFVTFNNCSTDGAGGPGAYARMNAQGWVATFNNLKVTNSNKDGPDHYGNSAPVGISVYQQSSSVIPGNVVFKNVTISGQANPGAGYFNFPSGTANSSFSCASCTGGSGPTSDP